MLYGLTTVLLYSVLIRAGMPGFYDKLLQVPLLNLSAGLLDRLARSPLLQRIESVGVGPGAGPAPASPGVHQRVGGCLRRDERVRVLRRQASRAMVAVLAEGVRGRRALRLRGILYFLQDTYCEEGSAWACNELGILLAERYDNRARAAMVFERACGLGFSAGCDNTSAITQGDMFRRDSPTIADYPFILRGSKGSFPDREPAQLYARACDQGWPGTCRIQ